MQNQDVHHQNPRLSKQSGNALWFILIAIALLAALTLTMTRNSGKVADNLDEEQVRIVAQRLARDLAAITSAVQRLKVVNNCSDEELSFDNDMIDDEASGAAYNPKAPVTGSRAYTCHLYDARGGGLTYSKMPAGLNTPESITAFGADFGWFFSSTSSIIGIGPDGLSESMATTNYGDLIASVPGVTGSVCEAYNQLARISGIPEDTDNFTAGFFSGTYEDTANFFDGNYFDTTTGDSTINSDAGDDTSALFAVKTACFLNSSAAIPHYVIYGLLIAR